MTLGKSIKNIPHAGTHHRIALVQIIYNIYTCTVLRTTCILPIFSTNTKVRMLKPDVFHNKFKQFFRIEGFCKMVIFRTEGFFLIPKCKV